MFYLCELSSLPLGWTGLSPTALCAGLPKGAMLTNGAMASTIYAVESMLSEHRMTRDDVNISYLPASHVFERELQVHTHPAPLRAPQGRHDLPLRPHLDGVRGGSSPGGAYLHTRGLRDLLPASRSRIRTGPTGSNPVCTERSSVLLPTTAHLELSIV